MDQLANRVEMHQVAPRAWIDRILQRMSVMYGSKFTDQWKDVPREMLTQEWAADLSGYTGEEIAAALESCKQLAFPPTLPEFLRLCRPALIPEIAFQQAVRGVVDRNQGRDGEWSHPAIFWAAVKIGHFDLMHLGYSVLRTRWDKALRDSLASGRWDPIPQAHVALDAPGRTDADRAAAKEQMKRLGAENLLDQNGRDHRRWIQPVLDKKHASPTVRAMARRASGMDQ